MLNLNDSVLAVHMGEKFSDLSPLLRQAHLGSNTLEGTAQVKHGNIMARMICRAFRFPKAGNHVHLKVNCQHTDTAMVWQRYFDGVSMQSHFRQDGKYLVEKLGALELRFKAVEHNGSLHYQFIKTHFWGIPMPNFLSPQVVATEQEVDQQYHFSVVVKMFLIGMVISYGGELTLTIGNNM